MRPFLPCPDSKDNIVDWIADFGMGYAEGFFDEVKGFLSGLWAPIAAAWDALRSAPQLSVVPAPDFAAWSSRPASILSA